MGREPLGNVDFREYGAVPNDGARRVCFCICRGRGLPKALQFLQTIGRFRGRIPPEKVVALLLFIWSFLCFHHRSNISRALSHLPLPVHHILCNRPDHQSGRK